MTWLRSAFSALLASATLTSSVAYAQESVSAGGVPVAGPLVPAPGLRFEKCKIYLPLEYLHNASVFKKKFAAEDLTVQNNTTQNMGGGECDSNGVFSARKAYFDFIVKSVGSRSKGSWGIKTDYVTFSMQGKMERGRFVGPTYTRLTIDEKSPIGIGEIAVIDKRLMDKALANTDNTQELGQVKLEMKTRFQNDYYHRDVYYRDGFLFLGKDDYLRPQREKEALAKAEAKRREEEQAKRKAEEATARAQLVTDRSAALSETKCDQVKALDAKLNEGPLYGECLSQEAIKAADPKQIFVTAGKLEASGDRSRAKKLYLHILESFPKDDLAIKATEQVAAITRTEGDESRAQTNRDAVERAGREQSEMMERAKRDSKEQTKKVCLDQKYACERRCESTIKDPNKWFGCKQGCPTCFF